MTLPRVIGPHMHPELLLASLCSTCLVELEDLPNGGIRFTITYERVHACHYCTAGVAALTWGARADRDAQHRPAVHTSQLAPWRN